jgi:hypothetical protein
MQKKFKVYSDPGHAWVKVPLVVLVELGVHKAITPYSYLNGLNAYLEEDCDASAFFAAYKEETGESPVFKEVRQCNSYSRIRNYSSYTPRGAEFALLIRCLNLMLTGKMNKLHDRALLKLKPIIDEDPMLQAYFESADKYSYVN